jgi:lysosomal-associated transmembrane protein
MRWKFDREDPNMYKCCLCCHVRTGTIFLGIFHLLVHFLLLSLFAVVVLHPELAEQQGLVPPDSDQVPIDPNNFSAEGDNYNAYNYNYQWFWQRKWSSEDKFLGLLITMGCFLITVLLVYGAAKGHAGYLMPFFCLQVFDFCVSCLTIVGYFSYMPDIKKWIAAQDDLFFKMPYKEQLLAMDDDWLMLLAVLFFVLVLSLKVYFIGVVWACYKYLTNYHAGQAHGIIRPYDLHGEDAEMLLPPKYEDVLRMSAEEPAPPPYEPAN